MCRILMFRGGAQAGQQRERSPCVYVVSHDHQAARLPDDGAGVQGSVVLVEPLRCQYRDGHMGSKRRSFRLILGCVGVDFGALSMDAMLDLDYPTSTAVQRRR
jgi:hypothetical protein